jgi:C4-dicarboxylate-specific signal transduction histidine kinase
VANAEACLRWLGRGEQGLTEVSTILKLIISDSKLASEIVQRIRGLSKRADLEQTEVNVNDVIEEVLPLVQREVTGHRALLQLDLDRELSPVLADRVQLQQVIINLILHAVQAMTAVTDRSRALLVRSTQTVPDRVVVAIQDSGVGIKPEDAERFHHQTRRHGHGAVDMPLDHRNASWTDLGGGEQCQARSHCQLQPAGALAEPTMMARRTRCRQTAP